MEIIEENVDRELVGADKLENLAGEAFFEFVDAVSMRVVGETVDAVEIIAFVAVVDGVLHHVPLDGILGVVVVHVFFIAPREEIDDLVACEHKHGS